MNDKFSIKIQIHLLNYENYNQKNIKKDENSKIGQKVAKVKRRMQKNPLHTGYNDNMSAINHMIDDGIWYNLVDEDASKHFTEICKLYTFKQKCFYVFHTAKDDHIVNSDESFFRCNQINDKTWAKVGKTDISIKTNSEEKEGFTFLATICFDGTTFPLVLLSSLQYH